MMSSKVLDTKVLLSPEKRKELSLKEQKLKESCRQNLKTPLKSKLSKRVIWHHITNATDCSSF